MVLANDKVTHSNKPLRPTQPPTLSRTGNEYRSKDRALRLGR